MHVVARKHVWCLLASLPHDPQQTCVATLPSPPAPRTRAGHAVEEQVGLRAADAGEEVGEGQRQQHRFAQLLGGGKTGRAEGKGCMDSEAQHAEGAAARPIAAALWRGTRSRRQPPTASTHHAPPRLLDRVQPNHVIQAARYLTHAPPPQRHQPPLLLAAAAAAASAALSAHLEVSPVCAAKASTQVPSTQLRLLAVLRPRAAALWLAPLAAITGAGAAQGKALAGGAESLRQAGTNG